MTANDLMGKIRYDITFNSFRYTDYFPNSPRAALFGETKTTTMNIQEAMEWWYEIEKKNWSARYKKDITYALNRHIIPHIGNLLLSKITSSQIKSWMNDLDVGYKTINNILSHIRGMFSLALENNLIDKNPVKNIKNLKYKTPPPNPLRSYEVDAVLETMGFHEQEFYETKIWTGLRTGEQSAITWDDIDFNNKTIYVGRVLTNNIIVGTKNDPSLRLVEMLEPTYQALKRLEKNKLDEKWVFINPATLKPWANGEISEVWNDALEEEKLEPRVPYQTRHTFATLMLNAGIPLQWIKEQMGHTNYQMLERRYAKWQHDPNIVNWLEKKTRGGHNGVRFDSYFYRNQ